VRSEIAQSGHCSASDAPTPILSILIVNWNAWGALKHCLASLYGAKLPANTEVIVIDNASTDGTPQRIRELYPRVDLRCFSKNIGHTKSLNHGFALARGEFILLLDPDTVLIDGCVERLIAFLRQRPDVYLAAPRTFNTDGSVQETARNLPGPLSGLLGRQSALTRLFPNNPISRRYLARQHRSATEPFAVEQIGGACMFFRRELLEKVGPWDERYFAYWVDTDWCCRLKAHGLPIFCIPAAQIVHHESNARGKRKSVHRIWLFHYGAWQFYTRWRTFGPWDPRSVLVGLALLARALLQLALNIGTKPDKELAARREESISTDPWAGGGSGV
jgi:N-acetylglucosaminyl-diphospho-decaprenol L-rhamnosyltransferase